MRHRSLKDTVPRTLLTARSGRPLVSAPTTAARRPLPCRVAILHQNKPLQRQVEPQASQQPTKWICFLFGRAPSLLILTTAFTTELITSIGTVPAASTPSRSSLIAPSAYCVLDACLARPPVVARCRPPPLVFCRLLISSLLAVLAVRRLWYAIQLAASRLDPRNHSSPHL